MTGQGKTKPTLAQAMGMPAGAPGLLLAACILVVMALACRQGLYAGLAPSFAWRTLGLSAAAMLLLAGMRASGVGRAPTVVLAACGIGFVVMAGVGNAFALGLLLCTAFAVVPPRWATGAAAPSVLLLGLACIVAVVGWLLPYPVHLRGVYWAVMALLCLWRRKAVWRQLGALGLRWRALERRLPGGLMLVVVAAGLASFGLWLPSLNYDDNAVHLLMPYQLLRDGYWHLDPSSQTWAVSPWANNVLGSVAALLAGDEARPAVAALWLLLGVNGAWRLARAAGAKAPAALAAAALYAAMPLTVHFTTTMQVDGASAAVLMHLAALLLYAGRQLPPWPQLAALLGLLAGLKASNGLFALPVLVWLTVVALRQGSLAWLAKTVLMTAVLAGSSYGYAALITGNPFFPLFNGTFQSPFYPPIDFMDRRWMKAGLHWHSLWDLTFETNRFGESDKGAFGIALLALLPALLVDAIRSARVRWVTVWFVGTGVLLFLQIQYARYLFPALAPLVVLGVVGVARQLRAGLFAALMVGLMVAHLMLVPTTSWLLRDDPWRALFQYGPAGKGVLEREKVPERAVLRDIFTAHPDACVLMADPKAPFAAPAGGRAFVVKDKYDPRLYASTRWAEEDPSGARWARVLSVIGPSRVLTGAELSAPLLQALTAGRYVVTATRGSLQVWAAPGPQGQQCGGRVGIVRDEARKRLHPGGGE